MGVAANFKLRPRKCIACGGTGFNSKGGKCYPCEGRGDYPWFRCNRCNRISGRVQPCPKCGCPEMRMLK